MSLNWLTLNSRTGSLGVASVFWPYLKSLSLIVVVGYSSFHEVTYGRSDDENCLLVKPACRLHGWLPCGNCLGLWCVMNWYFLQFGLIFFGTLATGFVWGYLAHKSYIEDQENQ